MALNTWIYLHQDETLEAIAKVTGKSKADIVREAFTMYINTMKTEGLVVDDGTEE